MCFATPNPYERFGGYPEQRSLLRIEPEAKEQMNLYSKERAKEEVEQVVWVSSPDLEGKMLIIHVLIKLFVTLLDATICGIITR